MFESPLLYVCKKLRRFVCIDFVLFLLEIH